MTELKKRSTYNVTLRGTDRKYKNLKRITLVNENVISGACVSIPYGPWITELAEKE